MMRPDTKPTAQERTRWINALVRAGYTGPQLAQIITATKTRGEIATELISLFRQAPKGN